MRPPLRDSHRSLPKDPSRTQIVRADAVLQLANWKIGSGYLIRLFQDARFRPQKREEKPYEEYYDHRIKQYLQSENPSTPSKGEGIVSFEWLQQHWV